MRGRLGPALVALLVGALVAGIWLWRDETRLTSERQDLELRIDAATAGWVEATNEFFRAADAAAALVADVSGREQTDAIQLLRTAVNLDEDLDAAFIGRIDGSFSFVARTEDGYRTRVIAGDGSPTQLGWLDEKGDEIRSEVDEDDEYDPRERPWFEPVAAGAPTSWSSPYTFASSGAQGITYSRGVRVDGEVAAVIGVDVRLDRVSEFLRRQQPGPNGESLIVTADLEVIASSQPEAAETIRPDAVEMVAKLATDPTQSVARMADSGATIGVQRVGPSDQWFLITRAVEADFLTRSWSWAQRLSIAGLLGLMGAAFAFIAATPALNRLRDMRRRADRDELTGVYARGAVIRRVDRALRRSDDVTVAIVDLDGFKAVNDTWGHLVGDQTLRVIADRMNDEVSARPGLVLGRLGGDEFIVAAIDQVEQADEKLWQALIAAAERPVALDETEVRVGASIGVARAGAGVAEVETVLRAADRALYAVKRDGGGTWATNEVGTDL